MVERRVSTPQPRDSVPGLLFAFGAFAWWGLTPLFWKLLAGLPPGTLLAHRITWAAPVFLGVALAAGQGPALAAALRSRRQLGWMALSAVFVATNWLVYLIAVMTDRVMHASLGYFLNPMLSTVLGALVLGERLERTQWIAVGAAFLGVSWLGVGLGSVPWIGLVLAGSFALYGLIRKQAPVPALAGSAVEVLFCAPFAVAAVGMQLSRDGLPELVTGALLLATGVITAVPLILFAAGVRRIRLSTLGVLQYLAPSLQFGLAVLVFDEPFDRAVHLPAFVLIWVGVAVYLARAMRARASM